MIIIDPRYILIRVQVEEDEWIPIRPGTDAALVNALAYVMIKEDLVDKPFFLDKYCVGLRRNYDARKGHLKRPL